MLSMQASAIRVAQRVLIAVTHHPCIIRALATEERALRLVAAIIQALTGSVPVLHLQHISQPPPALTVPRAST